MKKKKVRKNFGDEGKSLKNPLMIKLPYLSDPSKRKPFGHPIFFLYTYLTLRIIFIFLFLSHNQSITFITSFSLFFRFQYIYTHMESTPNIFL